jgi:cold shock CspA family protein
MTRIEGTLSTWNDDRGFGFITPRQGGNDVFVHVSAFPRDGRPQCIGESLSFEVVTDPAGKKKAISVARPTRIQSGGGRPRESTSRREGSGLMSRLASIAFIAAIGVYAYSEYPQRFGNRPVEPIRATSVPAAPAASSGFRCDGRTYCREMTSCAEATFFLRNCPDVKMDGNHDGTPCEEQWCNGL